MKVKISLLIIISILFINHNYAQERTITGKITDIKGNPLGGVTVTAKDYPSLTTISGVDGEFRIDIFDFTKALIFSFSGMKTKEVPVGDLNRLLVVMEYMPLKNPNPWSVMFNLYAGKSDVYNKAKDVDQYWDYHSEPGAMMSMEVEYFITQNIGIGTGIGFNTYISSTSLTNFSNVDNNILRVDQDRDTFYLYSIGSYINERIKVKTLSIPLKLKIRIQPGKKWSFYGDFGVKFHRILSAKNKVSGNTEWQAYYPKYHVLIYDVAPYGYTNYTIDNNYSLIDYEKSNFSLIFDFGVSRRIKKELNLDFGFFYDRGLGDLKYDQPVHPGDFLNTVGIVDKTTLRGIGFMLGIRYHLTKKM